MIKQQGKKIVILLGLGLALLVIEAVWLSGTVFLVSVSDIAENLSFLRRLWPPAGLFIFTSFFLLMLSILYQRRQSRIDTKRLEQQVQERTAAKLKLEIGKRKKTEEKLIMLAKFPSENPSPVIRITKDGVILYANDSSMGLLKEWGCEIAQCVPDPWRQSVANVYLSGSSKEIELKYKNKFFSLVLTPVKDSDYVILYGFDITERKMAELEREKTEEEKQNLQFQLLQSQKLESVGRLSSGVAHDFNNMLSVIIGYSELALMNLPEVHPVRENLNIIKDAGEKASALTGQLLAFSRKQILEIKVVNLNSIIENMKMLTKLIGEDILLKLNIELPTKNIMADPGQIEQILMNLTVNARDAMPCGGRLIIETADVVLDEEYARLHEGVRPGSYIMLSVTDTGVGMNREVQEKLFEPFFTTKEVGKGTGLGFSTVYGIVKQHKAYIFVYSEEGKGTTFKIYFPATEKEAKVLLSKVQTTMQRGTETILVVDDEPSIRDLVMDSLQPLGYKVTEASCYAEALQICEMKEETIDLLLTDVIMPGKSGRELADLFQEKQPETKIVFMSGYSEKYFSPHEESRERIVFIQKPLVPSMLTKRLREILEK